MKKGWLVLLFVLLTIPGWAQVTSRVTGLIEDATGAVIPDAKVTLTNEATNVAVSTSSTSAGSYVFDGIQPGSYRVLVEKTGFSSFSSSGNALTIGQPMVVNARLQLGSTLQSVDVKGGAELVQTETSGNIGNLVDQLTVTTLPIVGTRGRSPLDLIELQPGVVDAGGFNSEGTNVAGGGVSVNGSRDRAWNYTLDGIDINETSAGGSNFSPLRTNPDSISQFRVLTSNFTSEYGRNSGAQVEMITRSGTNQFHGTAFYFYQTPGLNANDPGNKTTVPPLPRPQFLQRIPGGSIGGPIIKDKTFFFFNVQTLHTRQSVSNTSTVYTAAARKGFFDTSQTAAQTAEMFPRAAQELRLMQAAICFPEFRLELMILPPTIRRTSASIRRFKTFLTGRHFRTILLGGPMASAMALTLPATAFRQTSSRSRSTGR